MNFAMPDPLSPAPATLRSPGSLQVLQSRVTAYARKNDLDVKRLNQRICTEVMFGTLARAKSAGVIETFLAKGGMALEIRFGLRARASRDLDLGILATGRDLIEVFDRVLKVGYDDFTLTRPKEASRLENVATYRFQVKVQYKGRTFGTLDIDLNEASHETAITVENAGLLVALGLPGPIAVPLLDPYLQLAHKLHGATEPSRADYTNRRHRDVLDVLIMASDDEFRIDFPKLRDTVVAEFRRRQNHSLWPPLTTLADDWREPLERDARLLGMSPATADHLWSRFIAFIASIEGVTVRPTYEYVFVPLQLQTVGSDILTAEAKREIDARTGEGWRTVHTSPRPGYEDQLLLIMERAS